MKSWQIYVFIVIFIFENASAQSLDAVLKTFVQDKQLTSAKISILAIDVTNNDTVLQWNPNLGFATASTAKLFSTAVAYEVLGEDYRMSTKLYGENLNNDGIMKGDLWIHGGGDVSFGSKFFNADGEELNQIINWADSLKKLGINQITGKVIVDASDFGYEGVPQGWSNMDIGNYYGAFAGGINVYDNVLKYYFKTGKPGSKALLTHTYPNPNNFSFSHSIISAKISSDQSNIIGIPYNLNRNGTGRLPANKLNYVVRGSIPDPEQQMAEFVYKIFTEKGIKIDGGTIGMRLSGQTNPDYDKMYLLINEQGRTVDEIASWTNQRSVNLFAEGLLNAVGYKLTGKGDTESSLKVVYSFLSNKIDTSGLILNDGCGLSRENKISSGHFCDLLCSMTKSKNYSKYLASIPIAGRTGTAKSLCDGQIGEGRVYAKSGTINGIKSYAGYVNTLSGKNLAFAISVNGFNCSSSYVVTQMEKILNALVML